MKTYKYTTSASNKIRTVQAETYEDAAIAAMFDLGYRAAKVVEFKSDNIVEEIVYRVYNERNQNTCVYIRFQ